MTRAIFKHDRRHLRTVGLFVINDQAENLPIGLTPRELAPEIDYFSVHLYPRENHLAAAANILKQLSVGKPVVVEELAPLNCSIPSLKQFIESSKTDAAGWLGFYWGKTPDEYRKSTASQDALTLGWLELFQKMSAGIKH
jgi:hypothetical protein